MDLHSGELYWYIKNGLNKSYRSVQSDLTTDVLIIGTGISGGTRCLSPGRIRIACLDGR